MQLDTPIEIISGRSFAPLRAVAQGMGGLVFWDSQTQTVTIVTPNKLITQVYSWRSSDVPGHFSYYVDKEGPILKIHPKYILKSAKS
ncbi:MAG: stalk domain-containing protein [Syntrophomonadales bacterium]